MPHLPQSKYTKKTLKRECVHLLNATLRLKIHRLNIAMDFSYRENAEMSFREFKGTPSHQKHVLYSWEF